MIAIPGNTVVSILEKSIRKNRKDRTLIQWNEETACRESTRILTDNVANVFWPQVMEIKELLAALKNPELAGRWIKASLCDGEDEKSEELRELLRRTTLRRRRRASGTSRSEQRRRTWFTHCSGSRPSTQEFFEILDTSE